MNYFELRDKYGIRVAKIALLADFKNGKIEMKTTLEILTQL